DDFVYRIRRKGLFDSLATLNAALMRMIDEPESKRRAVQDIHLFSVQNYLIAAHVAALRILMRRHLQNMPVEQVQAHILQAASDTWNRLGELEQRLAQLLPQAKPEAASDDAIPRPTDAGVPDHAWSGWLLLQRRLGL